MLLSGLNRKILIYFLFQIYFLLSPTLHSLLWSHKFEEVTLSTFRKSPKLPSGYKPFSLYIPHLFLTNILVLTLFYLGKNIIVGEH